MQIISKDQRQGLSVVALTGRFDAQSAGQVEAHLQKLLQAGAERILLDLTGVDYIASAGLRVLLGLAKKIEARNGRLVMCGLTPYVREVFQVVGFAALFEVHPDCARFLEGD